MFCHLFHVKIGKKETLQRVSADGLSRRESTCYPDSISRERKSNASAAALQQPCAHVLALVLAKGRQGQFSVFLRLSASLITTSLHHPRIMYRPVKGNWKPGTGSHDGSICIQSVSLTSHSSARSSYIMSPKSRITTCHKPDDPAGLKSSIVAA